MNWLNTMLKDEKQWLVSENQELKAKINDQTKEIIMLQRGYDQYQDEKAKCKELKKANQTLSAKLSQSE